MAGKSARYAWVFIVVAAIGLALGGNLLWSLLFGPSLSGSIQAAGPEIGTWVLTPRHLPVRRPPPLLRRAGLLQQRQAVGVRL